MVLCKGTGIKRGKGCVFRCDALWIVAKPQCVVKEKQKAGSAALVHVHDHHQVWRVLVLVPHSPLLLPLPLSVPLRSLNPFVLSPTLLPSFPTHDFDSPSFLLRIPLPASGTLPPPVVTSL